MHHWWKDRDNSLEISDSQLGLRLSKAERFCIFHGKKPNTFISRIWHNSWRPGMDDKVWKLRNFSLASQIIYKNSVNSSLLLNIQWNRQFHEIIAKNAWERNYSLFCCKNFVKVTFLLKSSFDEIFFWWE